MGLLKNLERKKAAEAKTKLEVGGYGELTKKEKELLKKYYPNSNMN